MLRGAYSALLAWRDNVNTDWCSHFLVNAAQGEFGLLFIQAVTFADIPVMAACLRMVVLISVVINLVVDLLYFVVDPRLRVGGIGGP